MMNYNNLIFEEKKDFSLVKINRPEFLNALNQETINELTNCFEFINENSKTKYGVIITGEGEKAFARLGEEALGAGGPGCRRGELRGGGSLCAREGARGGAPESPARGG